MFKSLWFRLSAYFSALLFIVLCIQSSLPIYILEETTLQKELFPQIIQKTVESEELVLAQAIKDPASIRWQTLATNNLYYKLINIHFENEAVHFRSTFEPYIYFQIMNNNKELVFSSPEPFPDSITPFFLSPDALAGNAYSTDWQRENSNYFWITKPLIDSSGHVQGHINLLFIAEREDWAPIFIRFKDSWQGFFAFILSLFLLGLVCGVSAAWLVTRHLKQINKVTAIWREGNLVPRIKVSRFHDDVLTEHSHYLNAMADDLESLFTLRQRMATTEERNRVARELHDTVKQNLFALNLQLASIKYKNQDADIVEHIVEAKKITREAQADLMEILTQLHPPEHDESRFYSRISTLSEDIWKRFKVEVAWHQKEFITITPKQEHTLIRVAQESISNAIRHGKATKISMALFQKDSMNYWHISDNGSGFFVKKNSLGFGLISMRERVEELPGGKFSIGNNHDGGTIIKVEWMVG